MEIMVTGRKAHWAATSVAIASTLAATERSGSQVMRGRSLTTQCIHLITERMQDELLKHQLPTSLQAQP
jgi:hypothetical protein